jgi:hypothetical protein
MEIAKTLAARLEADSSFPLNVTVKGIGQSAMIELVSREAGDRGNFEVAVSVASKQTVPSITATTSGMMRKVPILLSGMRISWPERQ